MWIRRKDWDALNAERVKAAEEARVLFDQNSTLRATMQWAIQRVEHVEIERALLLKQYMGVSVQVPQFVKPEPDETEAIGGAHIFNDIGDDEAKRRGIGWDETGALVTAK